MKYRLLILLTAIIGTGATFGITNLPSLIGYNKDAPVTSGTIIGDDWYNQVSQALSCPDGQAFIGFDDTTGEAICSSELGGGGSSVGAINPLFPDAIRCTHDDSEKEAIMYLIHDRTDDVYTHSEPLVYRRPGGGISEDMVFDKDGNYQTNR